MKHRKKKKNKLLRFSAYFRHERLNKETKKSFLEAERQYINSCTPLTNEFLKEWNIEKVATIYLSPEEVNNWAPVHHKLSNLIRTTDYHFTWPSNRKAVAHMKKIGFL